MPSPLPLHDGLDVLERLSGAIARSRSSILLLVVRLLLVDEPAEGSFAKLEVLILQSWMYSYGLLLPRSDYETRQRGNGEIGFTAISLRVAAHRISERVRVPVHVVVEDDHDAPGQRNPFQLLDGLVGRTLRVEQVGTTESTARPRSSSSTSR